MRDGIATVRYELEGSLYEREAFVSAPDGAFVMHLRALGTGELNVALELGSPHPSERDPGRRRHWLAGRQGARARRPALLGTKSRPLSMTPPPACALPQAWPSGLTEAWCTPQVTDLCGWRVLARSPCSWRPPRGTRVTAPRRSKTLSLSGTHAGTSLAPLLTQPYEVIRARHVQDHSGTFRPLLVAVGSRASGPGCRPTSGSGPFAKVASDEGLCALLFHYGRYLLMASSRPRHRAGQPAGDLERPGAPALELQLDDQHQRRNELLARRDRQPGRVPRAAHGPGGGPLTSPAPARPRTSMAAGAGRPTTTLTFGARPGRQVTRKPTRTG